MLPRFHFLFSPCSEFDIEPNKINSRNRFLEFFI